MKRLFLVGVLLVFVRARAEVFVRDDLVTDPAPGELTVCHGNGCAALSRIALTPEQWHALRRLFHPMAQTAGEERERLRSAIAQMEAFVGAATGTWNDKGGTFNGGEGQMDCIDESINTTLYLTLFQKYGLMRRHRVEAPATRGWFIGGWPHTSAVISEKEVSGDGTKKAFWAVDSWFGDNGEPPYILPLELWKSGWEPLR